MILQMTRKEKEQKLDDHNLELQRLIDALMDAHVSFLGSSEAQDIELESIEAFDGGDRPYTSMDRTHFVSRMFSAYISTDIDDDEQPFMVSENTGEPGKNRDTFRKYAEGQRNFCKKRIKTLYENPDVEEFTNTLRSEIDRLSDKDRQNLCDNLQQLYPRDSQEDLARLIAMKLTDILRRISEESSQGPDYDDMEHIQYDFRFISRLTVEESASDLICDFHRCCAVCGNSLTKYEYGRETPDCGFALVDPMQDDDYDNLVPLCNDHYERLREARDQNLEYDPEGEQLLPLPRMLAPSQSLLTKVKDQATEEKWDRELRRELNVEEKLSSIIMAVNEASDEELDESKSRHINEPVRIDEKIPETDGCSRHLKREIKDHAAEYYPYMKDTLRRLEKEDKASECKVRECMSRLYDEFSQPLDDGTYRDKKRTYEGIATRLWETTKIDLSYCRVVTSCFVRNCEIFEKEGSDTEQEKTTC